MSFCIHCGTQNPDIAKFCSNCGQPVTKTSAPDISKTAAPSSAAPNTLTTQSSSSADIAANKESGESGTRVPVPPPPQTTSVNQSAPASPQPSTQLGANNPFLSLPAFWGSLLVVLGFFLPWMPNSSHWVNSENLSGAGFTKTLTETLLRYDDGAYEVLGLLAAVIFYLMPASAAYFAFDILFNKRISKLSKIIRFIPISVFLILFILIFLVLIEVQGRVDYTRFKIGIILALGGAACMISLKRK
jgi:zinc-ribbon domain